MLMIVNTIEDECQLQKYQAKDLTVTIYSWRIRHEACLSHDRQPSYHNKYRKNYHQQRIQLKATLALRLHIISAKLTEDILCIDRKTNTYREDGTRRQIMILINIATI